MKSFESVVILKPRKEEDEKIQEIGNKIKEIVADPDMEIDIVGNKKLAYTVGNQTEGYFIQYYFKTDADKVTELENYYRSEDEVLKYIVIRIEEE